MQQTDAHTVQIAIASFAVVILCLFATFASSTWVAFRSPREGAPKSLGLLFQRAGMLRLLTVVMVIFATVILQLLNALTEGSVAILSGIAGYVLGGLDKGGGAETKTARP
jgi:hypothetical protein